MTKRFQSVMPTISIVPGIEGMKSIALPRLGEYVRQLDPQYGIETHLLADRQSMDRSSVRDPHHLAQGLLIDALKDAGKGIALRFAAANEIAFTALEDPFLPNLEKYIDAFADHVRAAYHHNQHLQITNDPWSEDDDASD